MTERYIADLASFKQTASGEFYGQWEKKNGFARSISAYQHPEIY